MSKGNFIGKATVFHLFCCVLLIKAQDSKYSEKAGEEYLKRINEEIQVKTTESVLASWAYESNITDENLRNQLEVSARLANFTKEIWKETIKFPWKTFQDPDIRRQFQKFSVLGTAILSPEKYERFNKIISDMQSTYGKAKICNYFNQTNCTLQLEPELTEIFVKSRNPDELRYYWEKWRDAAGRPVRQVYKEYVDLANEAAVLNNFTNNAEFWLKDYEAPDFKEQVEALWQQLRPLYLQLHAYVRRRLREQYGEEHVTKRGPIPAHLLGNMWAQSWGNIFDFTAPYPGKASADVTPNMVEQGYTPLRMFKLAEEFFTSLNLSPMPDTFWKNSILEKPNDGRDLICHASAWDFYDGKDFRIKQCTRITMEDLNTVHHEMGHIQYFLQYKNQPLVYKEGTNPGFHEAVGDVMALSVSTPKHLRKIGLLSAVQDDAESEINQLFSMALDKIAFLPFGYLMDQWRWGVFEGNITEKDYNCRWWQLREKYQGLSPSVVRTEADFDPGAKYHTVGNVPYIRYFVSFVIQFQFHRSLCIAAKEYDPNNPASKPLHKCDIYQSKEAGALLKEMLQMGCSKPWPDAMEVMTGQRKMDAHALLEYFSSLQDWLEKENKRTGEYIGWESSQKACGWEDGLEGVTPSLTAKRNFEDENIGYSYAEFVRQDDNAFEVPDYVEESDLSSFDFPRRLKESVIKKSFHLPRKTVPNDNDNAFSSDKIELRHRERHSERNHIEESVPEERIDSDLLSHRRNPAIAWPNSVFDLGTKKQELEISKLKRVLGMTNDYPNDLSISHLEDRLQPFDRQQLINIFNKGLEKRLLGNPSGSDVALFEGKKKSLEENSLPLLDPENNPEKNSFSLRTFSREGVYDYPLGTKLEIDDFLDQSAPSFESMRSFENNGLKPNDELILKAEEVKSQAMSLLRNCSLAKMMSQKSDYGLGEIEHKKFDLNLANKPSKAKFNDVKYPEAELKMWEKDNIQGQINSEESLPAASAEKLKETSSKQEKPVKNAEDSASSIPTRLLRKKLQNLYDERRNPHKKNEEMRSDYARVIGKPLNGDDRIGSRTRLHKKSYKEYSEVKTPVLYNSVVITNKAKGEKPDDVKENWIRANYQLIRDVKSPKNTETPARFQRNSEQVPRSGGAIHPNFFRNRLYEPVNR